MHSLDKQNLPLSKTVLKGLIFIPIVLFLTIQNIRSQVVAGPCGTTITITPASNPGAADGVIKVTPGGTGYNYYIYMGIPGSEMYYEMLNTTVTSNCTLTGLTPGTYAMSIWQGLNGNWVCGWTYQTITVGANNYATCAGTEIGGVVYHDANENGTREAGENGAGNVTIKAYNAAGTLAATTTSATDGIFKFTGLVASQPYRLEYSWADSYLQSGAAGTGSGTSIQFVNSGTCTANFGINYPANYCQTTNPYVITPCYVNGNPQAPAVAPLDVMVTFPYKTANYDFDVIGQNAAPTHVATASQIGATWAVAYQKTTKYAYAGAVMRRYSGFGPLGTGGIYKINMATPATPSVSNWVDVKTIGINTGNDTRNGTPANTLSTAAGSPAWDAEAFNQVGKVGIGGMDFNDRGDTLWLMNLSDRKLYGIKNVNPSVTPTSANVIGGYTIALPSGYSCVNGSGDLRPWAVKYYKGLVYVGVVCSGEATPWNNNNMRGYVLSFNPTNPASGFSYVTDFPLEYGRLGYGGTLATITTWMSNATLQYYFPQPMVSDIEFDVDGSMILGIGDRGGLQTGHQNYHADPTATDTNLDDGDTYGDVLRFCKSGSTYIQSGVAGCPNPAIKPYTFPEYYWGETGPVAGTTTRFNENAVGSLAFSAGSNSILITSSDSYSFYSGGVQALSNTSGGDLWRYVIFDSTTPGSNGKAAGLGDLEPLCDPAPIEIGNRVWLDSDKDGIQDAGEMGLPSIQVQLYQGATLIATTTTDANGQYIFTGLLPNTAYQVQVNLSQAYLGTKPLSTANVSTNGFDLIDNDMVQSGSVGIINVTTGGYGENNHTLDIGFQPNVYTCSGNLLINPSFELDALNTTPPTGWSGTGVVAGNNMNEPDGTQFAYDNDGPAGTLYQDVATKTGDTWNMTFFAGSHNPGTQTVTLRYLNASLATVGTPSVHTIVYDTDLTTPQTLGGPYSLSLGSAPSTAVFVRVEVSNNGFDFAKVDAFCLTKVSLCPSGLTLTQTQPTCTNGTANNNGKITLTAITNADKYGVSSGSTYTGVAYTSATALGAVPPSVDLVTNIPNIGGTYTIRFFNGSNTCFSDTTISVTPALCPTPCVAGNTGGRVWLDFNSNGIIDAIETVGLGGVKITAYNNSGTVVATTTTDYLGQYSFGTILTYPNTYRIEFSNIPAPYKPTFNGTNGRTDVQFVSSANCTVNLGVNNPQDYCQTNPLIATTCFVSGSRSSTTVPLDAIVTSTTNFNAPSNVSVKSEVGSVWGLAYNNVKKKLFSAAFLKRYVDLGNLGLGGIYVSDFTNPTTPTTNFINLGSIYNLGTLVTPRQFSDSNANGVWDPDEPAWDVDAYGKVGKIGLGDLELSDDNNSLFAVDLFNKKVIKIDLTNYNATGTLPTSANVSVLSSYISPGCSTGSDRPFGLKFYKNKLYIGIVCDGQPPMMQVQAYDFTTGTWSVALPSTSLSYSRPPLFGGVGYCPASTTFVSWSDVFNPTFYTSGGDLYLNNYIIRYQPMLSDIEFDNNGNMVLGIMDRMGHQMGLWNYGTNTSNTTTYATIAGGDILRATPLGTQFVLESNPTSNEFFKDGGYSEESSNGGLASYSLGNNIIMSAVDPVGPNSGGLMKFNAATGALTGTLQLYDNSIAGYQGKGSGIGDVEALCTTSPLQIGNYVWIDADKDGVQDPSELPLSNITVTLWKAGVQIASVVTNANGEYYFSDKNASGVTWTGTGADTTLLPLTAYEVRISMGQSGIATPNYSLTTANSTINSGNDQNDSDASIVSGAAVIALTTGTEGSTNHTYDFGFIPCIIPSNIAITKIPATCTNSVGNNNGKITLTAISNADKYGFVSGATYTGVAYTSATALGTVPPSVDLVTNIPNTGGTYTIRFFNGSNICFKDTTITVPAYVSPTITSLSSGFTECIGGNQTLSVTASGGTLPLTYQWQSSPDGITWTNIAGATASTYTPLSTTAGTTLYRVVVSGSSGSATCDIVTSSNITVVIVNDPVVTVTTLPTTVCVGANLTLTANPTGGTGTCTLQWQSSPDGTTWTNISGATNNNLNVTAINTTTRYRAQMTCTGNGCCN
jgi:hypothetical protein